MRFFITTFFVFTILLSPFLVFAQSSPLSPDLAKDIVRDTGQAIGANVVEGENSINFGVASPVEIVTTIINTALGFVGIIFLIYIVYAGFLYLTARGDADQIKKAISIIRRSIIGAALVLLSLTITFFVAGMVGDSSRYESEIDRATDVGGAIGDAIEGAIGG
jgi:cytochrome c biogenesis factor